MIFLFLFSLLNLESFSADPFYPAKPSFERSFNCGMGDVGKCLPISRDTLAKLDLCSTSYDIAGPLSDIGALLMNRYADTVFFQELAHRSSRATDCQVELLKENGRPQVIDASWDVYEVLQPLLRSLVENRDAPLNKQKAALNKASVYQQMGMAPGLAQSANKDQPRVDRINSAIDQLLTQVPFGSHPEVKAALKSMTIKDVKKEEFSRVLSRSLVPLAQTLSDSQKTFTVMRNSKTGEYNLDQAKLMELYHSPGAQDLVSQLDPSGLSLKCVFDSCYKTGPRNIHFARMIGLAGMTVMTLGEASPLLLVASAVGSLAIRADMIQKACYHDTFNASAYLQAQQCSVQSLKETTKSQIDKAQCAVQLILGASDIALPGASLLKRP